MRPVFTTCPARANVFVPGLVSVPWDLNQAGPFRIMDGKFERVSTLFMMVGLPKRPFAAG